MTQDLSDNTKRICYYDEGLRTIVHVYDTWRDVNAEAFICRCGDRVIERGNTLSLPKPMFSLEFKK